MKTVIVGGVAGGASAAARLRRLDEAAEIVLFERSAYISYANCGLPYYVGGEIKEKGELTIQTPDSMKARFNIDVRTRNEVLSIDRAKKQVRVRDLERNIEYMESYDKLVLSPGAQPVLPPLPNIDDTRIFTLRTVPDALVIRDYIVNIKPASAVVVGGGYIGVEMAENLKNAGLDVTIVELTDHLIAPLDADMACDVHNYLREKGVRLKLGKAVKAFECGERLKVILDDEQLAADLVILSVGVKPESGLARDAGLVLGVKGAIAVDEHMRTSDPDIYAVGDAVQVKSLIDGSDTNIPLAGPANRQGRIAADNIAGREARYKAVQGSSVLKLFDMCVATTGFNEHSAKAAGFDCEAVLVWALSHAGYYPGARFLNLKVIFERGTYKILGAQAVGFEGVEKRMDVLATAMRSGLKGYELAELELCYAPPFSSAKDPVNVAGNIISNIRDGLVKQFQWHKLSTLKLDKITLLDVRNRSEHDQGFIAGSKSIPLPNLRERYMELPKDKPVYVHCHSGLRSYVACRLLTNLGYDCYNLAGGWREYAALKKDGRI